MEGEGMVAVVRGLRDAGLAVTLLDGNRQYTLMPNSIAQNHAVTQKPACARPATNANASTQQTPVRNTADSGTESAIPQCDSGAQAVDGRYASTYKTFHCNMRPTSPPVQLTEFPPQRPELCPGHGNFQVGGTGSGATYTPIRSSSPGTYRGGLCWPDRGAVCSPRPSLEVDAFANSLRKYPNLSPDRSSEVMERLINYTQSKGLSKTFNRATSSPTREPSSHGTIDSRCTYTRSARSYEPEVNIKNRRVEETPTRDKKKEDHTERTRGYDVRCVRDLSKRLKDNNKTISSFSYNQTGCPTIREIHDCQTYEGTENPNASASVNMEIQAAVKMISREVATLQREQPSGKTVGVANCPILCAGEGNPEGDSFLVPNLDTSTSYKSIQTPLCPSDMTLKPRKSAQNVCSSIDFYSKRNRTRFMEGRKSKSHEEINLTKEDLKRSLLELIEDVSTTNKSKKLIRDELIKRLFESDMSDRDNKNAREKSKRERVNKYVSTFCPTGCDYVGDFQELVGKLKRCYGDSKPVSGTEIKPLKISEYKQLDFVLKDWINDLNIKNRDVEIEKKFDRKEVLRTVEDKIKNLFKNRSKQDIDLKSEIVKILEEIPIEVYRGYSKKSYVHRLVNVLLRRMRNVVLSHQNIKNRKKVSLKKSKKILTEDDIRDFLKGQLFDFYDESNLDIADNTMNDLENELIFILIDSIDCIRCGHVDDARQDMKGTLQVIGLLTDKQADCITNEILPNFKEMVNDCNFNQTYMILHSNVDSSQYGTINNNESISGINEEDLSANLDFYTNQLVQQINEWLDSLNIPYYQDRGFREVVVNDLAGDIVDRRKYLELNPEFQETDENELETLKYQIFKWINKLVGEENTETIERAQELLSRINSVPIPMLIHPQNQRKPPPAPFDPMRPCLGETGPTCRDHKCKKKEEEKKDACVGCCRNVKCKNRTHNKVTLDQSTAGGGQGTEGFILPGQSGHMSQGTSLTGLFGPYIYGNPGQYGMEYQGLPDSSYMTQGGQVPLNSYGQGYSNMHGAPMSYQGQNFSPSYGPGFYGPGSSMQGPFPGPYSQDHSFGGVQAGYGQPDASSFMAPDAMRSPNQQQSGYCSFLPTSTHGISGVRLTPGMIHSSSELAEPMSYNRSQTWGFGGGISDQSRMMGSPEVMRGYENDPRGDLHSTMCGHSMTNMGNTEHPCCPGPNVSIPVPSLKQLNDEYDHYLRQWVEQIPITANTPKEKELAEKAKVGILNGIWKAITKMKLDYNVFSNPYYYQDVMDDEIEALLSELPKTPELEASKHKLKVDLIQKTIAMNEKIRDTHAPASFKQQLMECIQNNLPTTTDTDDVNDTDKENEAVQKLNLAENFILYTRYKDEDLLKASIHKNNFYKKLEAFLINYKCTHKTEFDINTYMNEIKNALDKVPVPHMNALREEGEEILLGIEVENWISDLPQDSSNTGPLESRRIRDGIVNKIQELGTIISHTDCSFARPLKNELPKYLEKLPIQEGANLDFMLEELANRVKNLAKDLRQPPASLHESTGYDEFSRNMPGCSSFTDHSMFRAASVVRDQGSKTWMSYNPTLPEDQQWQSMDATGAPADLLNWSHGHPSMQHSFGHNVPAQGNFPGSSYSNPSGVFSPGAQKPSCCKPENHDPASQSNKDFFEHGFPNSATGPHGLGSPSSLGQGQRFGPSIYGRSPQGQYGLDIPKVPGSPAPYNRMSDQVPIVDQNGHVSYVPLHPGFPNVSFPGGGQSNYGPHAMANLQGPNKRLSLQGSGMQGPTVHGPGMHGLSIQGPGIQGADILGPGMHGPGIYGAGIQGPGMHRSGMHGSGIQGPGVQGPSMQGAYIQGSGIQGPGILGAGVQGPGVQGPGMHVPGIQELGMHGLSMQGTPIQGPGMQISGPSMQGAHFQGPGMQGTHFQSPVMQAPGMQGPSIQGAGIQGSGLQGPIMQRPSLHGGSMQGPSVQDPSMQSSGPRGPQPRSFYEGMENQSSYSRGPYSQRSPERPGQSMQVPGGLGQNNHGTDGPDQSMDGTNIRGPGGFGQSTPGPRGAQTRDFFNDISSIHDSSNGPGQSMQGPGGFGQSTPGPRGAQTRDFFKDISSMHDSSNSPGQSMQGPGGFGQSTPGPRGAQTRDFFKDISSVHDANITQPSQKMQGSGVQGQGTGAQGSGGRSMGGPSGPDTSMQGRDSQVGQSPGRLGPTMQSPGGVQLSKPGPGGVGFGGVGPSGVGPGRVSLGGVGPSGIGSSSAGPGGVGTGGMGPGSISPVGVGSSSVDPRGARPGGIDTGAVGTGSVGPGGASPGGVGPGAIGTEGLGPGGVRPGSIGSVGVSPGGAGAGKGGLRGVVSSGGGEAGSPGVQGLSNESQGRGGSPGGPRRSIQGSSGLDSTMQSPDGPGQRMQGPSGQRYSLPNPSGRGPTIQDVSDKRLSLQAPSGQRGQQGNANRPNFQDNNEEDSSTHQGQRSSPGRVSFGGAMPTRTQNDRDSDGSRSPTSSRGSPGQSFGPSRISTQPFDEPQAGLVGQESINLRSPGAQANQGPGSLGQYSQDESFSPSGIYGPASPGQGSRGPQSAYGPGLANSFGPRGNQSHPSVDGQVQTPRQLNQTAQSSGPVSAASQVPDSRFGSPQRQNAQQMARGGMFDSSQRPGLSGMPMGQQFDRSSFSPAGAQAVFGPDGTLQPNFYKSTDREGIRQFTDKNKGHRRCKKPCGKKTPRSASSPDSPLNATDEFAPDAASTMQQPADFDSSQDQQEPDEEDQEPEQQEQDQEEPDEKEQEPDQQEQDQQEPDENDQGAEQQEQDEQEQDDLEPVCPGTIRRCGRPYRHVCGNTKRVELKSANDKLIDKICPRILRRGCFTKNSDDIECTDEEPKHTCPILRRRGCPYQRSTDNDRNCHGGLNDKDGENSCPVLRRRGCASQRSPDNDRGHPDTEDTDDKDHIVHACPGILKKGCASPKIRDNNRKIMDLDDSDESSTERQTERDRCRCKRLKNRKNRRLTVKDIRMDYPPCYPIIRYPYFF